MDRITRSILAEFSATAGIEQLDEPQQFEHLAAAMVVGLHTGETFNTFDVVVGSGADTGLDAVAVIVNGALVTDPEMVAELAAINGFIDATFVLVQAETSSSFNGSKFGTFGSGALDFFSENPRMPRNDAVKRIAEVMEAVFAESSKFKHGNPLCYLYYVTTGRWVDDDNVVARMDTVKSDLTGMNLFRTVEIAPIDAERLQHMFRASKNAISRDFTFADRIVLPEMPGVTEAYLGIIPARELVTLLRDDAGGILRGIFYDNVRDWQDYNPVNTDIRSTLQGPERARFVLMNNGVTLIAKGVRATGNRIRVEDYQIVNGCQTCHVLFNQLELLDESVNVPLRVIATSDESVTNSVIKATNRQTEVKAEQLIALSEFQKKLETYFLSFPPAQQLYYERRSRQYNSNDTIEKTRIITPPNLIRSYAAVIRGEPHRTTRSYRTLLEMLGTEIFGPGHQLEPYYLAAAALYRLEFLYRNGVIDSQYRPARYHILYALRLLMTADEPPHPCSHQMLRYAHPLIDQVWGTTSDALFQRAAEVVGGAAAGDFDRDKVRTQTFTEAVKREVERERAT